ncbi:hypothetical protein ES332_D07G035400v1 [Gossypium tomentosum]|uniref:Histone acetyltransferase n=1 Tax=Gossypium tomentosum TaxID=34277 RepID=A0A5D2K3Y2_GOSTO|nr:hypothetical protein ES332_D07G035400v1 [Gossypium tomentosum]
MPRPGPRPYVFEKKSWHSDRHQPIRGSLVQEIFRVVNEIHSSATKKNKEWQEKLPVVVLKAEEIMYSKANSEAEYMDLKTLWDRTNDAINTIIRRNESTETGKVLQPCIEAALNLGCTARRTSRNQRNCSPRCYLNPGTQETENTTQGSPMTNPHCLASYSGFESEKHTGWNGYFTANKFHIASENGSLPINKKCLSLQKYSVYPLYYGNDLKTEELQHGFGIIHKMISDTVEPAKMVAIHKLLSLDVESSNGMNQIDARNTCNNPHHKSACDLSLRLGPLSTPCLSVGNDRPAIDKSLPSFHRRNRNDPLNSSSKSNNQSVEGEHIHVDASMRKRKTVNDPTMDRQHCLSSEASLQPFNWKPEKCRILDSAPLDH